MKLRYILFAILTVLCTSCGVRRSQAYYDYKTELIGTELDGTYTLRAWGRARNAADAYVQAQKQAVYDVVFTGAQASTASLNTLKPLLTELNAKEKYEDYFNKFFADGGEYRKYCSMKEKKTSTSRYIKNKPQMLCQTTVCVDRAKLKAKLIEDNILKK